MIEALKIPALLVLVILWAPFTVIVIALIPEKRRKAIFDDFERMIKAGKNTKPPD